MKAPLQNLLLVAVSVLAAGVMLEGLSRTILDPVDFLELQLVEDPVLGHAIAPGSAGHDSWGFRNPAVPDRARIVAIGDSQTYGVSATASDSWPSILQTLSGKTVYNLSLGGYGPVQYLYLLTHKAAKLRPEFVTRVIEAKLGKTEDHVIYEKHGIHTGFTPARGLGRLDLADPRIEAGLRISLGLFSRLNTYCLDHDMHLIVALIPTKTSVYAMFLESDTAIEHAATIKSLLANERRINEVVKTYFEENHILYVDLLPPLQKNASRLQLYPGNYDGHPNRNGYRVIAETLAEYLETVTTKGEGRVERLPRLAMSRSHGKKTPSASAFALSGHGEP